jgi:hypothetical protein
MAPFTAGTALALPPIVPRLRPSLLLSVLAGLLFAGCASTRVGAVGRLSNDEWLVTLVVTEDRKRVDERSIQTLPSAMAFEIEVHGRCHAVAGLQAMRDPCHDEHGGRITSTPAPSLGVSLCYSPLCSSSLATSPVHPVWWLAPRPVPSSPWKYS